MVQRLTMWLVAAVIAVGFIEVGPGAGSGVAQADVLKFRSSKPARATSATKQKRRKARAQPKRKPATQAKAAPVRPVLRPMP